MLQSQIVALATLTTVTGEDNNTGRTAADAEAEAAMLLTLLPDLAKASAERSRSLDRWAHNLYPAARLWWNSLEPDLLAEQLVATQFTDYPDVLTAALQRADRAALGRTLDLLARAVAGPPAPRSNLDARPRRSAGQAVPSRDRTNQVDPRVADSSRTDDRRGSSGPGAHGGRRRPGRCVVSRGPVPGPRRPDPRPPRAHAHGPDHRPLIGGWPPPTPPPTNPTSRCR